MQMQKRRAILLFTRVPLPGQCKTRLLPVLSGEECAALQGAMVADDLAALKPLGLDILVFYAGPGEPERLSPFTGDAPLFPQEGDGLGARMDNAIRRALDLGYEGALLLGSDLPFLDGADVARAGELLDGCDIVLCPSADGGYWLVGMDDPFSPLFSGQRYGGASVLEDALEVCRAHGRSVALGPVRRDLDTPEDLAWFLGELAAGRLPRRGRTAPLLWAAHRPSP